MGAYSKSMKGDMQVSHGVSYTLVYDKINPEKDIIEPKTEVFHSLNSLIREYREASRNATCLNLRVYQKEVDFFEMPRSLLNEKLSEVTIY